MALRPAILLAIPLVLLVLSSCVTAGHDVAEKGRQIMIGMDSGMVQACAGIPTRTKKLDAHTEIYSYEIKNENRGGVELTIPVVGGGFKMGASGSYCDAVLRLVDGRVVELNFTGDNDDVAGHEGVCAPIVRGCLRAREREEVRGDPEVKSASHAPEGS